MALVGRAVVVGLGSIGRRHARLLLERTDLAVEAVEPSREVQEQVGHELERLIFHSSFEAMLASSPDTVWITSPTPFHAQQSLAALEAGAHVFCEKPMCDMGKDSLAMLQAADRYGKVLNVGYVLHFSRALQELKRLIDGGTLGRILHAHAHVGTYRTLLNSVSRYQETSEGSLFLDYSHQPDLFFWLLGKKPIRVNVTAFQAGQFERSSNPNMAIIVCNYDEPLVTTIHLNYVQSPERHEYEVIGDLGWARVSLPQGIVTVGLRESEEENMMALPQDRDDMFRAEQEAFITAVQGSRGPETSAADGVISIAICEAAIESWRTGRAVSVM